MMQLAQFLAQNAPSTVLAAGLPGDRHRSRRREQVLHRKLSQVAAITIRDCLT